MCLGIRQAASAVLAQSLGESPVVAAVRDKARLTAALASPVRVVFLLCGDMFSLPELVSAASDAGKPVFVHLDLVDGVSRDAAGVRWIARAARPVGVLSTRAPLLRSAADEGLQTVLRIFLVDSSSMETGVRMVKSSNPDFVEIMPGLVTRAIAHMGARIEAPVIAGGMMERREDVTAALRAGAIAVSTSNEALWK